MELKTTDGLTHAKQIKDSTKRLVNHIDTELKQEWKSNSKLYQAGNDNNINDIHGQYNYAVTQGKKAKQGSNARANYFHTTQQLYKKFALQFINQAAHHDSSFQMLSSRLYNVGSNKSNQPLLNWDTSEQAIKRFMHVETHYVHEFSGQSYSWSHHPNVFKAHMKQDFNQVQKYVNQHHWHKGQVPSKLFANHHTAMRMLGVSDQNYYNNAVYNATGKHIHAPVGLYNISGKDMGGLKFKNAYVPYNKFKNRLSTYRWTYLQNGTGEDLRDGYLSYTHQLQHSTTKDFKPTVYGKYAHPSRTINKEYQHVKNIKSQRFGTFFDKYPKYARKLHIMSGRQAKHYLQNRNQQIRQDMPVYSRLGLWYTAKKQLGTNLHKFQHLHVSQVYTQSSVTEAKQHVSPLNKTSLLKHLKQSQSKNLMKELNRASSKHHLARPFSKNSQQQKRAIQTIHTKPQAKSNHKKRYINRQHGIQR